MASLRQALDRFGFVTVFNPTFKTQNGHTFDIDSLRISNLTQEGPTKTIKGGLYANTQMRYGKTVRLEMEDVVGRIEVLQHLMGANIKDAGIEEITETFIALAGQKEFILRQKGTSVVEAKVNGTAATGASVPTVSGRIVTFATAPGADKKVVITYKSTGIDRVQITDKFAGAVEIVGKTFIIDSNTGEKEWINLIIPQFLPDSVFNITMEAEGDFGAINIAGEVLANECGVFYELTKEKNPTGC